ncbi:hypothetical protein E2562_000214 [Oryza meyeriana var. granulata]|uniref:Uncharacterized protein n=1 Tax=Oryza meyeriana var. granulata TaxID=110450 RepID=A0A6G1CMI4_9ORYZ|nr:hypothetical protein E2562_000214 [Oryza meyeriana var. granulata]
MMPRMVGRGRRTNVQLYPCPDCGRNVKECLNAASGFFFKCVTNDPNHYGTVVVNSSWTRSNSPTFTGP